MIRLAARTFKHLLLTIILIGGGFCALEVALRGYRVLSGGDEIAGGASPVNALLAVPSRSTYLSVAPRLKFQRRSTKSDKPYLIRTNSFGLRNAEIDIPKPGSLFRILCLGDETTLAADLPETETYCRLLADELARLTATPVEVLNGGCPGGCPTLSALLERHRLLGLQADVILVHIDPSDVIDEQSLRRHIERSPEGLPVAAIHPALSGNTGAASRIDDEFLTVRFARDGILDLWRSGHSGTPSGAHEERPGGAALALDEPWRDFRSALTALSRMATSQGTALIVTTADWAGGKSAKENLPAHDLDSAHWPPADLVKLCAELKLPLVDASDDVADAMLAQDGGGRSAQRLTPAGHAAYARVLAAKVLQRFADDSPVVQRNVENPGFEAR